MFLSDTTMRLLMELDAPTEQKVALLTAMRADEEAASAMLRRRSTDRERQERHRHGESRVVTPSHGTERDETLDGRPLPPSPPDPPNHPPPPVECVSTRVREAAFERFWAAYPRKDAKKTAKAKFFAALTRAPADVLMAAVEKQKTWEQWQRGFVPHAATWLHQERWNDEEPPSTDTPRKAHERPHHDNRQAAFADRLGDIDAAMAKAFEQPRR